MTTWPEYTSVEAFVEFCLDDERDALTTADLQRLNHGTRRRLSELRRELESYGLVFQPRAPERRVRGCTTGSNDRWYGPGAERTHGGSGWEQINRFAGDEG